MKKKQKTFWPLEVMWVLLLVTVIYWAATGKG